MPKQLRPAPEPDQVNLRPLVSGGIALFAIAAVVIALVPQWRAYGDGIWLWTAVAGAGLGLLGLVVMRWQRAP